MQIRPVAPLFVPATRPERFAKAAASGADAVIIDLEDAVAPQEKDNARQAARSHPIAGIPVLIRINGAETAWHEADVNALRDMEVAGVVLPKAQDVDEIGRLHDRVGREIPILLLIETARGMEARRDLLSAKGVAGAIFGSLDYALDLGCAADWEPLLPARMALVQTSRSLDLPPPIDGITTDFTDAELVAGEAALARDHGFGGKLAIHPAQIGPIMQAFRPGPEELAWAIRVTEAASSKGGTSFAVDGKMIDAPVLGKAQYIIAQSKRLVDRN